MIGSSFWIPTMSGCPENLSGKMRALEQFKECGACFTEATLLMNLG